MDPLTIPPFQVVVVFNSNGDGERGKITLERVVI